MKKLAIALIFGLVVSVIVAAPALAAAQKVPLNPIGTGPGNGFVVFNDTKGPQNVQIQMSLKQALPKTAYDVVVYLGAADPGSVVGTVTTNVQGNANFSYKGSVALGPQQVALELQRGAVPQFGTGPVTHTFK
jgi:hypothetical protein